MPKYAPPEKPHHCVKGFTLNLTRQMSKSRNRHHLIVSNPIVDNSESELSLSVPNTILETTRAIVGPDVSHYQNEINWVKMVDIQKNMGFAMCKATQGKNSIDSKFTHNITQMRETFSTPAGSRTFDGHTHQIAFGVYHFAEIIPTFINSDYEVQADWFYNTVANAVNNNINHFPNFWVLDWEDPKGNSISHTTRANFAKVFVQRLHSKLMIKFGESYVPKIFIYSGYYYWGDDVKIDTTKWFTTYGPKLWIAAYTTNNVLPETHGTVSKYNIVDKYTNNPKLNLLDSLGKWIVWQYSSSISVPGISSRCDVSVARSSNDWHSNFYQP
jgi:GH25 family lysozyme M1 (1,4-beta-N-acetylmuramidase)